MIIYEEVLRDFQKEKVKYAVVGGIAVNLLGSLRSTADLDIIAGMTDENLAKVVKILKKRGYSTKQPLNPAKIADKQTRENWINIKHMKAFNFYKGKGLEEIDLIIDSPVSYEKAKRSIQYFRAGSITIPVVSVDNLIRMKEKTGRMIDKLDIEELKKIKKLRERKNV